MQEPEIIETEPGVWQLPECCKENWESCPHTVKRQSKKRTNKGL